MFPEGLCNFFTKRFDVFWSIGNLKQTLNEGLNGVSMEYFSPLFGISDLPCLSYRYWRRHSTPFGGRRPGSCNSQAEHFASYISRTIQPSPSMVGQSSVGLKREKGSSLLTWGSLGGFRHFFAMSAVVFWTICSKSRGAGQNLATSLEHRSAWHIPTEDPSRSSHLRLQKFRKQVDYPATIRH